MGDGLWVMEAVSRRTHGALKIDSPPGFLTYLLIITHSHKSVTLTSPSHHRNSEKIKLKKSSLMDLSLMNFGGSEV